MTTLLQTLPYSRAALTTAALVAALSSQTAMADITEADLQTFARQMAAAANAKNTAQVSRLIDNDVLIAVTRKGKSGTLNKQSYLNLLQTNWAKTGAYSYSIRIDNVVTSGDQARANVQTIETLTEDGKPTKLVTDSRATFNKGATGVVLTRSISQLTIEQ